MDISQRPHGAASPCVTASRRAANEREHQLTGQNLNFLYDYESKKKFFDVDLTIAPDRVILRFKYIKMSCRKKHIDSKNINFSIYPL